MPNILFVSNNKSHFPLSNSVTTAGRFDANRVPYGISLAHGETISSPEFAPAAGNVTWLHHRLYFDTFETADTLHLIRGFDTNGNLLFSIDHKFNTSDLVCLLTLYRSGGTVVQEQTFPFNRYLVNSVDVRYENNQTNFVSCKLYLNGGLAANVEHTSVPSFGNPAHFSCSTAFRSVSAGSNILSEFIVADGDTRNARLDLIRPTAVGGETDWVGLSTALADDDPSSGMTSIAAEERQTLLMSAYGGALNISAIVVATQSVAGANGPQNMKHTVRMSTVNYDGTPTFAMGDTLQYNITDFKINPATSLPWVGGDLTGLEMGFISKP